MEEIAAEGLGGKLDFLEHFAALPGSRQALKVLYPLDAVLLVSLCAGSDGAGGWVSVALLLDKQMANGFNDIAVSKATGKDSLKSKRLIAAWDETFLAKTLQTL